MNSKINKPGLLFYSVNSTLLKFSFFTYCVANGMSARSMSMASFIHSMVTSGSGNRHCTSNMVCHPLFCHGSYYHGPVGPDGCPSCTCDTTIGECSPLVLPWLFMGWKIISLCQMEFWLRSQLVMHVITVCLHDLPFPSLLIFPRQLLVLKKILFYIRFCQLLKICS